MNQDIFYIIYIYIYVQYTFVNRIPRASGASQSMQEISSRQNTPLAETSIVDKRQDRITLTKVTLWHTLK